MSNISTNACDVALSALAGQLDNGYLRLYTGPRPRTTNDLPGPVQLLAELRFAASACGPAAGGTITANRLIDDGNARATGKAAWFRAFKADGLTAVVDGSVGQADVKGAPPADLLLNSVMIQKGARVSIERFTLTMPKR